MAMPVRAGVRSGVRSGVYTPGAKYGRKAALAARDPWFWVQPGEGIATATGISQWKDQSGYFNHLAQGAGASQPAVGQDNRGRSCANFDGINDFLQVVSIGGPRGVPNVVGVVVYVDTVDNTLQYFFDSGTEDHRHGISIRATTDRYGFYAGGAATVESVATIPTGQWLVVAALFNGASSLLRSNKTQVISGNPGPDGIEGITLGDVFNQSGFPFDGKIAEAVVVPTFGANTEVLELVEDYLVEDHGIAI